MKISQLRQIIKEEIIKEELNGHKLNEVTRSVKNRMDGVVTSSDKKKFYNITNKIMDDLLKEDFDLTDVAEYLKNIIKVLVI